MSTIWNSPRLSVIVCTYNPRADLITRALRALSTQSLRAKAYELIIVDNNSMPPIDERRCARLAGRSVRIVHEPRQGLTYARAAGIRAANADLLCFVDDDNELDPSYLSRALEIADAHPHVGVYGGVAEGAPEGGQGVFWRIAAPFLGVRDIGPENKFGDGAVWEACEPIGAGICVRRPVAEAYADFVDSVEGAGGLGRKGGALLSGEDSLLSRIAHSLGLQCGYLPELRLRHHITAARLRMRYLIRLMEGHGRSFVILEAINGRGIAPVPREGNARRLAAHFLHRLRKNGLGHALAHVPWDIGYARQSRELNGLDGGVSLATHLDRRAAARDDPAALST